jgi:hypothetical protein
VGEVPVTLGKLDKVAPDPRAEFFLCRFDGLFVGQNGSGEAVIILVA